MLKRPQTGPAVAPKGVAQRGSIEARRVAATLFVICAICVAAPTAAQEYRKDPVGFDNGARNMIDPVGSARDENGNLIRTSIDDIDTGRSTACGLGSTAFGNLISVVINGNGNTVDIEATQINNGDIFAIADLQDTVFSGC